MSSSRLQTRALPAARATPVSSPARRQERNKRATKARPGAKRGTKRGLLGTLKHSAFQLSLGLAISAGVLFASLDLTTEQQQPDSASQWTRTAGARPIWMVDVDGDGAADFANPTRTYLRGMDLYGSGSFGAGRDHFKRKHMGADFVATEGTPVRAPLSGIVTETGFAYDNDPHLRFLELTDRERNLRVRVFYVQPGVAIGKSVRAGDIIGAAQSLDKRYPLITNHVHVEIRDARGKFLDPGLVLPPAGPTTLALTTTHAPQAKPVTARRARAARNGRRAHGALPAIVVPAQVSAPAALPTTAPVPAPAQTARAASALSPAAAALMQPHVAAPTASPAAPQKPATVTPPAV